jgi:hypothetical protein
MLKFQYYKFRFKLKFKKKNIIGEKKSIYKISQFFHQFSVAATAAVVDSFCM